MIEGRTKGRRRRRDLYAGMDIDSDVESSTSESEHSRGSGAHEADGVMGEPDGSQTSPIIIRDEETITSDLTYARPAASSEVVVGSALRKKEDGTVEEPSAVKRRSKGPRVSRLLVSQNLVNFPLDVVQGLGEAFRTQNCRRGRAHQ